MEDGSDVDPDERVYTPSNHLDDLDEFDASSVGTGFSIDVSDASNTESVFKIDLQLDLNGVENVETLLPQFSDASQKKSVRLESPQDQEKTPRTIPDPDFSQVDTFRSKSSLRSTPKSFTSSQYLSTGTARSGDNPNTNNNFTFDQFLQTLENPDEPHGTAEDESDSAGNDHRTEDFDEGKSETLASKSELFSESLFKSDNKTLESVSGLNDIFGGAENKEDSKEYDGPRTSSNYISFPYGFQQKNAYEHSKKLTDLVDVTFNPRTRQFIFLDTRGITTWDKDGIEHTTNRSLNFPKYQNKLLRNILYARKYNVYFCLAKDFSLKVLNKDFDETCQVASDLSSVMFLLFNPVRDELITGGVKGTKVWEYKQMSDRVWTEIKPMANYSLFLKKELKAVGGSWVRKVELDQTLQHLYCCSDTDIQCYDMEGKLLFKLNKAHKSQINGCKYSSSAKLLITCANDCDVKVWSMTGGMVHTFRGHSRSVTNLLLHPEDSSLVLSSSLDGSVKVWSLDIMELLYSIVISTEGIQWMGLTGEKFLWTATCRDASVWQLNQTVRFFALARCKITSLQVAQAVGKTSRVVAIGEDSSVRLVSVQDQRNLSTVLPPPSISPLQQVQSVTYNRECSLVFVLVEPSEVWVYTMRTDPACRTAVWDVTHIQERWYRSQSASSSRTRSPSPAPRPPSRGPTSQLGLPTQRATLQGKTHVPSLCSALATVNTHVMYWTDEGFVSTLKNNFLLFGLQDGRILFLDPFKQGHRYCELQATRDAILDMQFDKAHSNLIVKSHLREEDLFQFWSVPGLELRHEVLVSPDVTSYARLATSNVRECRNPDFAILHDHPSDTTEYVQGLSFFTGHTDGSLTMFTLEEVDTTKNRFQHGGYAVESSMSMSVRRKEHFAPIVAVDSCPILGIIATCSSDGAVKIWDEQKTLMTEIAVDDDDTLASACFLSNQGDLMIGYKNHLFVIDHSKILPSITKQQAVDEILETESEIYEDPAVRYEGAAANPEPLSVDNYLVPFDLDFNERFLGGQNSPTESEHSSDKGDEEGSDSEFSMAATEVYGSQVSTPRLSVVDFLISTGEPIKGEIKEKTLALALKRRKKSRAVRWSEEQGTVNFEMPRFGVSPGPSPTGTPPSTPSEISESEDEIEEEEEEQEEEENEEQDFKPIEIPQETIPQEVVEKPKVVQPKAEDFRLPEHLKEESRFSRLKIDTKALFATKTIKDGTKKIGIKPAKVVTKDQEDPQKTTPQQAPAKVKPKSPPPKKKGQRGPRARVGERAASAAAKAKADKAKAAASKETIPDQPKPTEAPVKPKAEEPLPKPPEPAAAPKEEPQKQAKPEAKLSTTKFDIKPLPKLPEVRKGVKPGPVIKATKETPKKGSGKRQSIFSGFTKSKGAKKVAEDEDEDEDEQEEESAVGVDDDKGEAGEEEANQKPGDAGEEQAEAASEMTGGAEISDEMAASPTGDAEIQDGSVGGDNKEASRPGSTISAVDDVSRGGSSNVYKAASRAAIIKKYGTHRAQSASIHGDSVDDDGMEGDDTEMRIASAMSHHTESDILEQSQGRSSRGMRAHSAMSASSIASSRARTPYLGRDASGDIDNDFYPLEEVDLDLEEQPNIEVMLKRNGRIEHIGSASSRTESPFMRSVSQATGRVMSSRAGERSFMGSVLSDVEAELMLQERMSSLEDEILASEVGLPVSPEMFGRLARPNTAEGRARERRPHTAGTEMHVTFQDEEFDDIEIGGIPKFMSFPISPSDMSKCYKNDGLKFEENWQERMIERNRLIKMQKQHRAQSAANKRHLLELRQRQRRKALVGHNHCTDDLQYMRQTASPVLMAKSDISLPTKQIQRAKSAPAGSGRYGSAARPRPRQAFSSSYKEQQDFSAEKPYRLRLNQQPPKPRVNNTEIFETVRSDSSTFKPMLVRRAQSGKSIPSKTRRFVLITQEHPQPEKPIPSPLEKQLLKARFPKTRKHLIAAPEAIPRRHSTPNVSRVASVADFVM